MTSRTIVSCMIAVLMLGVGSVNADPPNMNHVLTGDYAFSGSTTCLWSENADGAGNFFSGELRPLGRSYSNSFMVEGVRSFDGRGNGTVSGRSVSVVHPGRINSPAFGSGPLGQTSVSASESTFSADFTYTVAADRTFSANHGAFTGAFTAGPRAGQSFTVTAVGDGDLEGIRGYVSQDGKTLILGT